MLPPLHSDDIDAHAGVSVDTNNSRVCCLVHVALSWRCIFSFVLRRAVMFCSNSCTRALLSILMPCRSLILPRFHSHHPPFRCVLVNVHIPHVCVYHGHLCLLYPQANNISHSHGPAPALPARTGHSSQPLPPAQPLR